MTIARSSSENVEKCSTISVLRSLSDDKSLELFKTIASGPVSDGDRAITGGGLIDTQLLLSKVKLTRKQYYSRISMLISSGLVKRSNGKYLLTSLGKVVRSVNALIDLAIQNHWKLKAIDALESKSRSEMFDEDREKIISMLIDNHELRGILTAKKPEDDGEEEQIYSSGMKSTSAVPKEPTPICKNQIYAAKSLLFSLLHDSSNTMTSPFSPMIDKLY